MGYVDTHGSGLGTHYVDGSTIVVRKYVPRRCVKAGRDVSRIVKDARIFRNNELNNLDLCTPAGPPPSAHTLVGRRQGYPVSTDGSVGRKPRRIPSESATKESAGFRRKCLQGACCGRKAPRNHGRCHGWDRKRKTKSRVFFETFSL
jgi:hypothetical protein